MQHEKMSECLKCDCEFSNLLHHGSRCIPCFLEFLEAKRHRRDPNSGEYIRRPEIGSSAIIPYDRDPQFGRIPNVSPRN